MGEWNRFGNQEQKRVTLFAKVLYRECKYGLVNEFLSQLEVVVVSLCDHWAYRSPPRVTIIEYAVRDRL